MTHRHLSLSSRPKANLASRYQGEADVRLRTAGDGPNSWFPLFCNFRFQFCFCVILSTAKDLARSASRYAGMARKKKIPPLHPGEVLYEDFIVPTGISVHRLAMDLRVPANRIAEIVKGAARNLRRHRASPLPLSRHVGGILARLAKRLRSRKSQGRAGAKNRARGPSPQTRGMTLIPSCPFQRAASTLSKE